jgi:hypothetical protein
MIISLEYKEKRLGNLLSIVTCVFYTLHYTPCHLPVLRCFSGGRFTTYDLRGLPRVPRFFLNYSLLAIDYSLSLHMIFPHPVLLSQHPVEYLARGRSWHLFVLGKDDVFGDFEAGDFTFAILTHFFGCGRLSFV